MTVAKLNTGSSSDPKPKQTQRRRSLTTDVISPRNVCNKLIKLIFVLIAFIAYGVLVPIFLVCMIPVYMYRGIVIILQKVFKPDWIGIMSSRDAIVGLDNTTQKCECIIMASLVFRGVPDVTKCREHFQKKVMEAKGTRGDYLYRKFKYYYENWLGFPFWKKEADFKLEEHFRKFDYNIKTKPMGANDSEESVTEDELLRSLGEIEALPFAKGRSPWEILVLPNYIPREGDLHKDYAVPEMTVTDWNDPNGSSSSNDKYFALVFRIHHAIGDGYSCLKMLMCHICSEPLDTVPKAPTKNYNFLVQIVHYIAILVFTPYYHFNQFFVEIDRSIWHISTGKLSKKSHFVSTERIPLESLKQVGKTHRVPMTGVFLAGLAGGIHNYLKLTGKGHQIPKFMRAFSPMPWQDHPAFTVDGMVNHWTVGVFGIPVSEDTPHKRLRACKKSMNRLVNSPILVSNFFTVPILLSAPNCLTSLWGTNWMTSMILSNFPGPKDKAISFEQHPLDNLFTFVPHMRGSAGIGIMFPTCLGNARCTVSVDSAILNDYSDAQFLVSLIDEEFRILRTLYSPNAENRI